MKNSETHLGFEIGTGEAVSIPMLHTVVTGQTQRAGKTTLLEAVIRRAMARAITFITKRGESSFADARRIDPYFKDQGDWEFVSSILEASRGERLKYERASMINASKGASTLAEVHQNVRDMLKLKRVFDVKALTCLNAYLDKVVPLIDQIRWSARIELHAGVNAMDLAQLAGEMQHLVIKSTIDWVLKHEENTVIVVPEAWKFAPQGRGTPVKLAAEEYVRQGAGLKNFLWMDSQDIAGVDKIILKSFPLWILGVQRESNEIERTLAQIPAGTGKPKPEQIARLGLGQFFVCYDEHVIHVYAQPIWMSDDDARAIARGQKDARDFAAPVHHHQAAPPANPARTFFLNEQHEQHGTKRGKKFIPAAVLIPPPQPSIESEDEMSAAEVNDLKDAFATGLKDLGKQIMGAIRTVAPVSQPASANSVATQTSPPASLPGDEEGMYQRFRARILADEAVLLKLKSIQPEIELTVDRKTIETDTTSATGMLAHMIKDGFFKEICSANAAWKEMKRRWDYGGNAARAYEACDKLTTFGFLTKEEGGYKAVSARIKEIKEK